MALNRHVFPEHHLRGKLLSLLAEHMALLWAINSVQPDSFGLTVMHNVDVSASMTPTTFPVNDAASDVAGMSNSQTSVRPTSRCKSILSMAVTPKKGGKPTSSVWATI
jgi:hypothetical protein